MLSDNYIVILDFMTKDLELKGSELLVYALIYGFSQDGESKFYGSRRYIAEWFNCSLPTIDKALNGLLEKNLIIKDEDIINGVKFNRFRCNKKTLQGIKKLYRGSKETLHNNTIYNTNKENITINSNIKEKKPTIEEIKSYCKERNNNIDAEQFYDFYESKNWMVGKNKMKDWKACIRTWERRDNKSKRIVPEWFNKNEEIEDNKMDNEEFNDFIKEFRNE